MYNTHEDRKENMW